MAKNINSVDDEISLHLELYQNGISNSVDLFSSEMLDMLNYFREKGLNIEEIRMRMQDMVEIESGPFKNLYNGLQQTFNSQTRSFIQAKNNELYLDEFREIKPDFKYDDLQQSKFTWVATLVNTCVDCLARHGQVKTLAEWQIEGQPGDGSTVCGYNCHCSLVPVDRLEQDGLTVDSLTMPVVKLNRDLSKDPTLTTVPGIASKMTDKTRVSFEKAIDRAYKKNKDGSLKGGKQKEIRSMLRKLGQANKDRF